MYLTKAELTNIGPIPFLLLRPSFSNTGAPNPTVLVGANGSGKSLVLAAIMDAMIEARKRAWNTSPEVAREQYLRYLSNSYVRAGTDYLQSEIVFGSQTLGFAQHEFATRLDEVAFNTAHTDVRFLGQPISPQVFDNGGMVKQLLSYGDIKRELQRAILLYYPVFRYAQPAWLNKDAPLAITVREKFLGETDIPVPMTNLVTETTEWILNTAFDMELSERQVTQMPLLLPGLPNGQPFLFNIFGGHSGPNTQTLELVNQILTKILSSADFTIASARVGISSRTNRGVGIIIKRTGENAETQLVPQLAQLSSGELMVFCMFCSIIRAHEFITGIPAPNLNAIKGTVLIDEIDLHLHIKLQMEVMPAVIEMFPNVQFILTTHSPFFSLGLTKRNADTEVVLLPQGMKISHDSFSEFQSAYDVFLDENDQYKKRYEELKSRAAQATTTLVVTEGKTDWKHLKAARLRLEAAAQLQPSAFEFLEYHDRDMGDTRLAQLCKDMALVPNARRMIFVFDRDNPTVVSEMSDAQGGYRSWGNNIYSLCIPQPAHRSQYEKISIEFLYTDQELTTVDAATGKRLFFDNEIEISGIPGKRMDRIRVVQPRQDAELQKKVYDQDCTRIVDANGIQIAHSKSVFAENVLTGRSGFEAFNIDAFVPLLTTIGAIVALP